MNVRESGFGLKSYLSSGRSTAIAISFRPMSFHPSSTAADGPRAGFGGSFALVSVCAKAGTVARQAVRQSPARNFHRFISLLRVPRVTQKKLRRNPLRVPVRGYCMLRRPSHPDVSPALSPALSQVGPVPPPKHLTGDNDIAHDQITRGWRMVSW